MAREVAPFKTERRASTLAGGQWERLARVRLRTLPSRRKDSRRRMAGGELRLGTEADHGCFARLHLHDDVPGVQGGSTPRRKRPSAPVSVVRADTGSLVSTVTPESGALVRASRTVPTMAPSCAKAAVAKARIRAVSYANLTLPT